MQGHSAPSRPSQLPGYLIGVNAYNILTITNPDKPFPNRLEYRPSYEPDYQLTSAWTDPGKLDSIASALARLASTDDSLLFNEGYNFRHRPLAQITNEDLERNLNYDGVHIYEAGQSDKPALLLRVHYEPPNFDIDERALVMPIGDFPIACINRQDAEYVKGYVPEPHIKTRNGEIKPLSTFSRPPTPRSLVQPSPSLTQGGRNFGPGVIRTPPTQGGNGPQQKR